MANTFELITSTSVGSGGASDITFSTIQPNWTDLCIVTSLRGTQSSWNNWYLQFNGVDTNYSQKVLYGNGATATSTGATANASAMYLGVIPGTTQTASTFTNSSIYIPNYAGSNYKSASIDDIGETNATTAYAQLFAFQWSNNAAITSIMIKPQGGTSFAQYSTAYLYGVKNA